MNLRRARATQIVMADEISLSLFILFLSLGMGGGLYEALAVYPNWKHDPTPQNFSQKLKDSGQMLAGRRFWPLVSPMTTLLAIVNIFLARQALGLLRTVWLAAAIVVILKSIATYTYFVPTMMGKLMKAETMRPEELIQTVNRWTTLSPLRLFLELFAWITAVWAWSLLGRA
jgi:tellurite resistance protein TehA-like permease